MQKTSEISFAPEDSRVENTLLFATKPFFHFFCTFMNLGSALIQIVIYFMNTSVSGDLEYTIYIQTLEESQLSQKREYIFKRSFNINILLLNSIFLIIAAGFHTYYAYFKIKFNVYISPKLRFIEYGIITPLMFLQLAVLAGVRDILTLITICTLVSNSMIFGYIQDRLSGVIVQWNLSPHEWGYMAYIVLWAVVYTQLFRAAMDPVYVVETYIIITIYFAYFSQTMFAVIQYYFVVIPFKRGYERIDDVSIMEMDGAVHLLSLCTKMSQVWIPVIGVLINNNN